MSDETLVLKAITNLESSMNDKFRAMESGLTKSIENLEKITAMDLDRVKDEIGSLKTQSREHYAEEKAITNRFAEAIVAHSQEDVRHIEELDVKIGKLGERLTNQEHAISDKVNLIENKMIGLDGEAKGKKSTGGSINTWVAFGLMVLMAGFTLFDKFTGGTP